MCHVCGKPFRVRSDMKRHMKTHPDAAVVRAENGSGSLAGRQEMASSKQVAHGSRAASSGAAAAADAERNVKPVLSETAAAHHQLELATSTEGGQTELFTYQRDGLEDDRENPNGGGTLYVWIQSSTDSILPDT